MKIFDTIQLKKPKSSAFDLSHERKMTMNMGDLVPCLVQEVLPGDRFRVSQEHLIRMHPMLAPLMHRVDVYTHYFFVPNRIIWNEFEDFITGGEDGKANPVFPTISRNTPADYTKTIMGRGELADYLGFPAAQMSDYGDGSFKPISALPFRAYQSIYNEYYRDQNLQSKIPIIKSSGNTIIGTGLDETSYSNFRLKKRAWEKDYFTSALPFAQRGDELQIPLQGEAPVIQTTPSIYHHPTNSVTPSGNAIWNSSINTGEGILSDEVGEVKMVETGMHADMTNVTGSTINELRSAFSIQKWLEKNARGGSRYVEHILTFFGTRSSDARLQRPEYLGGGKTPIIVSEVLQQSETQSTPLGTMAGHGISVGKSNQFSKRFEEHGLVMGIISVLPRTAYYQGLPKIFSKFDKFDYYWPDFAHLGEQEVKNKELYFDPNPTKEAENNETFGYQPRYTEYRFMNDTVHGDFTGNLNFWHMARKFENRPKLNGQFVQSNPTNRIYPVKDDSNKLLVQTYTNFRAIRPVAKYGNPGGI